MKSRPGILMLMMALFILTPMLGFIGIEFITPWQVWHDPTGRIAEIFWQLRLPRVLAGMLTGSALALGGVAFQALFRNPLATPYTLGTASAASWGAGLYIWSGLSFSILGISGQVWFAFGGALLSLGLLYGFSQLRGGLISETMLLAGVAIGFLFSSLILLTQYLANQIYSLRIMHWLMGGLEVNGYTSLLEVLPLTILGAVILYWRRYELNLFSLGEELAVGRGVHLHQNKILLFGTVGLMVAGVVALAGPIGFVGMIVPHICRLLLGPDHRRLILASGLLGGVFLPICDTAARLVIAPAEMPVGVITALLGGPFFIWILVHNSNLHK